MRGVHHVYVQIPSFRFIKQDCHQWSAYGCLHRGEQKINIWLVYSSKFQKICQLILTMIKLYVLSGGTYSINKGQFIPVGR